MSISSVWLKKLFPGASRGSRRAAPSKRSRRSLALERLEDRLTPSSNLQVGGVVHLPFTATEVEGTTGNHSAQVVAANADVNSTLLDFNDPTGTTADYSVTVTWGDGSSDTFLSTNLNAPFIVVAGSATPGDNFSVVPTSVAANAHVYDEAASGNNFTVQVTDVGSGATTGPVSTPFTNSILVTDAPLRVDAGPTFNATEGSGTGPVVLATFTDANPGDHTTDFIAAITWGDGTPIDTSSGAVSYNPGTGVYTVTGSHVYAEEGGYHASVRITDEGGFAVDTGVGLDGSGAVVTAASQTAGAWYPDRFPPHSFVGGQTDFGRTGVIDQTISTADADGNRPGFNTGFYDYQGRKYDLPPGSTYVTMDLYVPSSWAGLNQVDPNGNPANYGSLASLWGTGVNGSNTVTSFPIIGFNNLGTNNSQTGSAGFQVFDGANGWTNVAGFTGYDQWYQLSYGVSNGNLVYFVNGRLVYTDTSQPGTVAFSNVILQGYNGGNTYTIDWNPVRDTPANVADQQISLPVVTPPVAREGAATPAAFNIAHFTDFAGVGVETTADFRATIDWGDGSATDAGVIVSDGLGNYHVEAPAHIYADEGSPTITVAVTHDLLAPVSGAAAASVNDADNLAPAGSQPTVSATENASFSGPVAFFTDTGYSTNDPNDFTATIDWGDGSAPTSGSVAGAGAGNFTVSGTHTYADEGNFKISVTLSDGAPGMASATASNTAHVADADALAAAASQPTISGVSEGASFSGAVAFFTDAGYPTNDPNDFVATINWGDGATDTGAAVTIASTVAGNFTISGTHTYTEEGSYAISVTLSDDSPGKSTATASNTVAVADQQITNLTVTPPTLSEGQSTPASFQVATFIDPAGAEPITSPGPELVGNGGFETGDFTGWARLGDTSFTSVDTNPADAHSGNDSAKLGPTGLGYLAQNVATVSGQSYTLTYWLNSDGSTPNEFQTFVNTNEVSDLVNIPSQGYTEYSFTFTATSSSTLIKFGFENDNGFLNLDDVSVRGTIVNYSAAINWGDGSPTVAGIIMADPNVANQFDVRAPAHTYADEGAYPLTVTVTHEALSPVSASADVTVKEVAVVAVPGPNITGVQEGGSTGTVTVATFTDPGGAEATSEYRASINWGDGSAPSAGTISYSGGTFTVTSSHTYTEESPAAGWNVTTTITHGSAPLGLAADHTTGRAVVIDPSTNTVLGSVVLPGSSTGEQTAISPDGTLGFATNFSGNLFVIDLSRPASPTIVGTIPLSNAGEDLSVTPDGKFVVITGGSTSGTTVSVVSVASRSEVHTFSLANSATSVDASVPGIVLLGENDPGNSIIELAIDSSGNLTSTGITLSIADANNIVAAPGGASGVELDFTDGVLNSFTVAGLTAVSSNVLTGDNAISGVFNPGGTVVYARSTGGSSSVDAFGFNPSTGQIGSLLFTIPVAPTATTSFGVDQLGISQDGSTLYVPDGTTSSIDLFNASTGTAMGSIPTSGVFSAPNGIDFDGGAGVVTTTAITTAFVSDPAVVATGGFTFNAVEGVLPSTAQTVATFTDPGGAELNASEYPVTINWGDGTPTTTATVAFSAGTFFVLGNHTYAEEGSYTISVVIPHGTASTVTVTSRATVSDQSVVLNTTALTFNAKEGAASASQPVATFTDPGGSEAIGEYSAIINWGDGTPSTTGLISVSGGVYTVSGAHTYAEEGSDPITVTVSHGTAADATAVTATATVGETAVVLNGSPLAITANEGSSTGSVTVATFVDPAGPELTAGQPTPGEYSAVVNWGDGTAPDSNAVITWGAQGNSTQTFTVLDGHTYTEEGTYSVTVTVTHGTTTTTTTTAITATATVSDPSVAGTGGFTFNATEGMASTTQTVATFIDPGSAELTGGQPTPGEYTATITWGDGSPSTTGTITFSGGTFTVQGSHTYAEEGGYNLSVTLSHGTAPNVTVTSTATVADQSVVLNTTALTFNAKEGAASASQPVATFTDPAGAESLTEYSATIDWGDGSGPTSGTITYTGGTFTVFGGHTYAEEGSHPINVTVSHGASTPTTGNTANATVADALLHEVALTPPTNVTAGTPTPTNAVLYHFTDDNPGATTADFTATVNWGDGTSNTSADGTGAVKVVIDPNGGFDVEGEHTYLAATTPGTVNNPPFTFNVSVVDHNASTTDRNGGPVAVSGDVVVTDTTGGQNLTLFRTTPAGPVGAVSYVLGSNAAVALTNVHSFTFNGQGAGDSMTVDFANGGPLVPGGLLFNGSGGGSSTLTIDAAGQPVRTVPGGVTAGDMQTVGYTRAQTINVNNAAAVDAFHGPDTADRSTALPGLTADERFVQVIYLDALGRVGSKAELDGWASLFGRQGQTQGQTQAAIAVGIEHSAEGRDHLVKAWYAAFLGRQAQGGEEQVWVNQLLAGQTEEQVLGQILGGGEFFTRAQTLGFGDTAQGNYVRALYQVLMDRTASAAEVSGWSSALSAAGRQGVALDFLQSQEFRAYDFEGYYNALLHRPSQASDNLNNLVMSSTDIGTVRIDFESSPEFFTNG